MDNQNAQIGWTEAQWSQIFQAVSEQVNRASVVGAFLPCYGPLAQSAEVVRRELLLEDAPAPQSQGPLLRVDDVETIKLWTLAVHVQLKQQQLAEDNLTGALMAFRRAANLVATAEDAIAFNGLSNADPSRRELEAIRVPDQCRVTGGEPAQGLVAAGSPDRPVPPTGEGLVVAVASAIADLERHGHLGPFACVLGNTAFITAHTPMPGSMVLPRDRMEPLLGMPLARSGTMPDRAGIVVSLAADPIDLVVATAPTVKFLYLTDEARYIFRVYERFALRIKQTNSVSSFTLDRSS